MCVCKCTMLHQWFYGRIPSINETDFNEEELLVDKCSAWLLSRLCNKRLSPKTKIDEKIIEVKLGEPKRLLISV